MIADSLLFDLSDDPELSFLELESSFKDDLDNFLSRADQNSSYEEHYMEYISSTITSAAELDLTNFKYTSFSYLKDEEIYNFYKEFVMYVRTYILKIRIRHSKSAKTYSIPLDDTTKEKIRDCLGKMKMLCDNLDFSVEKKEIVFKKILDLELEMTRERTRFEIYAGLSLNIASTIGEIGKKAEPLRKLIDAISNLLGKAKDKEPQQSLPAPKEMKRIEHVKQSSLDDDVPF